MSSQCMLSSVQVDKVKKFVYLLTEKERSIHPKERMWKQIYINILT